MGDVLIAAKKFTESGNDAKKIYSGFDKSRSGDCYRRFMDSECAAQICAGAAG